MKVHTYNSIIAKLDRITLILNPYATPDQITHMEDDVSYRICESMREAADLRILVRDAFHNEQ